MRAFQKVCGKIDNVHFPCEILFTRIFLGNLQHLKDHNARLNKKIKMLNLHL